MRHLRSRRKSGASRDRASLRRHAPPRPRRSRHLPRRRRGIGNDPTGHSRPVPSRPPADGHRGRVSLDRPQRRGLQLRGGAAATRGEGAALPLAHGYRGDPALVRGARPGVRRSAAGNVRVRRLGCPESAAVRGAGSPGHQAAVLRVGRPPTGLRFRAEGPARQRPRRAPPLPRGARAVPDLRLRPRAPHADRRRAGPSAGAPPDPREGAPDAPALLGSAEQRPARLSTHRRAGDDGAAPRPPRGERPPAADQRRADRRLPERGRRLGRRGGADGRGALGTGEDLLHRLRRGGTKSRRDRRRRFSRQAPRNRPHTAHRDGPRRGRDRRSSRPGPRSALLRRDQQLSSRRWRARV